MITIPKERPFDIESKDDRDVTNIARESTSDRRARLVVFVAERGFVRVTDAAAEFEVSEVTIRGDLSSLEIAGDVVRVHGGAMPASPRAPEPSLEQALSQAAESKRAIGEAAASLVAPGQSVILDVGSTALAVATALVRRADLTDVTIVTNGLSIALALEAALPRFTVVMTGGTLRPLQHSLVNPGVSGFLESVHADLAIIGCNGVDVEQGVTNINFPEAEVKRRMVQSSTRRILIADGSKLNQVHLGVIGAVADFDVLVTSGTPPEHTIASIRSLGVEVLRADEPIGQ
jgi:DeoR family transcriptional regulator of aga operon